MFSTGQWIFAGLFLVTFIVVMVFMYRKDLKLHRKYYKNSIFILLGFIAFIALLFIIKVYLNE
ncbi:hypothetical protein PBT91_04900 [Zunongwangia sp. HGR-M22]|nr:hypothetical protein [Zunongwangia sp. HGR-M22]WBL26610.1 hypothetical protein PBT91_04900 [Zunongwangia sp. HGR-M22]